MEEQYQLDDNLNSLVGMQTMTQISDEHRLLQMAKEYAGGNYTQALFQEKVQRVSEEFFHTVLCGILNRSNYMISSRINAIIKRTETKNYSVKQLGIAEYVTEALYDNWWFTLDKQQAFRLEIRDKINRLIACNSTIEALFPVFYLKPYSPLKNRGPYPDIAEIYSLTRCYEVMQIINTLPYSKPINHLSRWI